MQLLCEDHCGTYVAPFVCERRDGAWYKIGASKPVEAAKVVGWPRTSRKIQTARSHYIRVSKLLFERADLRYRTGSGSRDALRAAAGFPRRACRFFDPALAETWTKTSSPPSSALINPKPLSALNIFRTPVAIFLASYQFPTIACSPLNCYPARGKSSRPGMPSTSAVRVGVTLRYRSRAATNSQHPPPSLQNPYAPTVRPCRQAPQVTTWNLSVIVSLTPIRALASKLHGLLFLPACAPLRGRLGPGAVSDLPCILFSQKGCLSAT